MPLTDHIRPEPNPPLTVERVTLARDMYAEGFPAARICAQCLVSLGTLYKCLDGVPFGADGLRFPPLPRRRNILGKRTRALRADPVSLRNRLIRTADRQVREIELRLALPERPGPERERDIRMLAMTVKSLRELARLAPGALAAAGAEEPPSGGPPEMDMAELRAALSRRLEAILAERTPETDAAGEQPAMSSHRSSHMSSHAPGKPWQEDAG